MMLSALSAVAVVLSAVQAALFLDPEVPLAPASWPIVSVCIWLLFVLSKGGWSQLSANDIRRFAFGIFAAVSFLHFLQLDSRFQGWSSVYYFCGHKFQYCNCNFRWNFHGWMKAAVLWQFVLSATLGAQQLMIQAGLGGLLPGEEAVTRESFISIGWRLIPYWLNNWEQQWGAEVSSMTFELPHFAVELLIILPCCQIICSRLRVLVTPQVNVLLGPGQGGPDDGPFVREDFAPNVLQGFWERRPEQRRFLPRVRSNLRVLAFLTGLTALAALNATLVPLYLEGQAAGAANTPAVALIGRHTDWLDPRVGGLSPGATDNATASERALLDAARGRYELYGAIGCSDREPYSKSVAKHAAELQRMQDPEHRALIPLVESALAIMRLSCEKYFVLIAIYVAFLLFRDAPRPARAVIRLVARVSGVFQKVILFAFPAVCWLYNAGFIFSLFVSVVFWGGPLLALYDTARSTLREVSIRSLTPASAEQVHRMGGSCAICWAEMMPQVSLGERGPSTSTSLVGQAATGGCGCLAGGAATTAAAAAAAATSAAETASASSFDSAAQDWDAVPCESADDAGHAPAGAAAPLDTDGGDGGRLRGRRQQQQRRRNNREEGRQQPQMMQHVPSRTDEGRAEPPRGVQGDESDVGGSSAARHGCLPASGSSHSCASCTGESAAGDDAMPISADLQVADDGEIPLGPSSAGARPSAADGGAPGGTEGRPPAAAGPASSAGGDLPEGDDGRADSESVEALERAAGIEAEAKAAGWALPCGHAYHHECLLQWMEQCSSTGVTPTCPMCQRGIQLQVRWRLPRFLRRATAAEEPAAVAAATARLLGGAGGAGGVAAAAAVAAGGGRQPAGGRGGGGGAAVPAAVAAAAAVGGDVAAGEELLDAVRNFAGMDAGLQVVGLLQHQRELQELLLEAPAMEFGEMLREAQPMIMQQAAQAQAQAVQQLGEPLEPEARGPLQPQQPPPQQEQEQEAAVGPEPGRPGTGAPEDYGMASPEVAQGVEHIPTAALPCGGDGEYTEMPGQGVVQEQVQQPQAVGGRMGGEVAGNGPVFPLAVADAKMAAAGSSDTRRGNPSLCVATVETATSTGPCGPDPAARELHRLGCAPGEAYTGNDGGIGGGGGSSSASTAKTAAIAAEVSGLLPPHDSPAVHATPGGSLHRIQLDARLLEASAMQLPPPSAHSGGSADPAVGSDLSLALCSPSARVEGGAISEVPGASRLTSSTSALKAAGSASSQCCEVGVALPVHMSPGQPRRQEQPRGSGSGRGSVEAAAVEAEVAGQAQAAQAGPGAVVPKPRRRRLLFWRRRQQ